jgi:signal transduction histidine kinase
MGRIPPNRFLFPLLLGLLSSACVGNLDTSEFLHILEETHRLNRCDPARAGSLAGPAEAFPAASDTPFHAILLAAARAPAASLEDGYRPVRGRLVGMIDQAAGERCKHTLMPELRRAIADLAFRNGEYRFAMRQLLDALEWTDATTPLPVRMRIIELAARINLAAGFPHHALNIIGDLHEYRRICEFNFCFHIGFLEAEAMAMAGDFNGMQRVLDALAERFDAASEPCLLAHYWFLKAWHALARGSRAQAEQFLSESRRRQEHESSDVTAGDLWFLEAVLDHLGGAPPPVVKESLHAARLAHAAAGRPARYPEMLLRIAHHPRQRGLATIGRPFLDALAEFAGDEGNLRAHATGLAARAETLLQDTDAHARVVGADFSQSIRFQQHFAGVMSSLQAAWYRDNHRLFAADRGRLEGFVFYLALILLVLLVILLGLFLRVRTQRHLNQRLQEAVEKSREAELAAEQSSRSKSRFLASVSHEIKTPMAGLVGMASLLDELVSDPVQRKYLKTIRTCSQNLLVMVDDLLDLGRMESGGVDIEQRPFAPQEVLAYGLQVVAAEARAKGLDLACDIGPEVPATVVGDGTRTGQILTNLLNNAVKFTEQGSVTLHAGFERTLGLSGILVLRVADTGPGIAPERLSGIFEPFNRAPGNNTPPRGGSGLGLAICRKLTELMGGSIAVESELGRGSTFTVTLPVRIASAA